VRLHQGDFDAETVYDDDPVRVPVDVLVGTNRRAVLHEIAAFDQHIGRAERDVGAAHRIDGEEADVRLFRRDDVDRLAGGVHDDQFQLHAEAPREFAGKVDGHATRAAVFALAGEDRIAEVDGGAQLAGRGERGENGSRRLHGHCM